MKFNVKYNLILLVNFIALISSLACIYNENLIIRIASAPGLMVTVFASVWLIQNMGGLSFGKNPLPDIKEDEHEAPTVDKDKV